MMSIGASMQQAMNPATKNPTAEFRAIIGDMQRQLNWMIQNKPEVNTERKQALISELDGICRAYEQLGDVSVWGKIWQKLQEAKDQHFDGDVAVIYIPLKPVLPDPKNIKQIIIDGCRFDFTNPMEYAYLGGLGKAFITSEMEG